MLLNIQKVTLFFSLITLLSFFSAIRTSAVAPNCDLITSTAPADLIKCASPDSLQKPGAPTAQARNLNEILNVINNTLAALAVFLSIIGAIVSSINIAKSQGAKSGLEDAKQMLTNSIMAFVITITIWLIVGLVLRTTGLN
jgi:hypothetical protein